MRFPCLHKNMHVQKNPQLWRRVTAINLSFAKKNDYTEFVPILCNPQWLVNHVVHELTNDANQLNK